MVKFAKKDNTRKMRNRMRKSNSDCNDVSTPDENRYLFFLSDLYVKRSHGKTEQSLIVRFVLQKRDDASALERKFCGNVTLYSDVCGRNKIPFYGKGSTSNPGELKRFSGHR